MARRYKSSSSSSSSLASNYSSEPIDYYSEPMVDFSKPNLLPPGTIEKLYQDTPKHELEAYYAQVNATEGFDVSRFPNSIIYGTVTPIQPLDGDLLSEVTELAKIALAQYNLQNQYDTQYEFLNVVMANWEPIAGFRYYITFMVKPSWDFVAAHCPQTFQARVINGISRHGGPHVKVEFCRPKPTHPSGSTFRIPKPHSDACMSQEDCITYWNMVQESQGCDVPDFPNYSEVPDLIRPIKPMDNDCLNMLIELSKLCVDHYNTTARKKIQFRKFVKANKRAGSHDEYFIRFTAKDEDRKRQTLHGWVVCDVDGPVVYECNLKADGKMME